MGERGEGKWGGRREEEKDKWEERIKGKEKGRRERGDRKRERKLGR